MSSIPSDQMHKYKRHASWKLHLELLQAQFNKEVLLGRYTTGFHKCLPGMKFVPFGLVPRNKILKDLILFKHKFSFFFYLNSLINKFQLKISMDYIPCFTPFIVQNQKKKIITSQSCGRVSSTVLIEFVQCLFSGNVIRSFVLVISSQSIGIANLDLPGLQECGVLHSLWSFGLWSFFPTYSWNEQFNGWYLGSQSSFWHDPFQRTLNSSLLLG